MSHPRNRKSGLSQDRLDQIRKQLELKKIKSQKRDIKNARITLFAIPIVEIALSFISINTLIELPREILIFVIVFYAVYATIFIALGFWSKKQPFASFVVGQVLVGLFFVLSIISGIGLLDIIKTLIFSIFLGNGIKSANKMKKNQKKNDIIDDIEF